MERRYLPFLGYLSKPELTLPTIQTNRLGFRDAAISPRHPGETRILLLGGSTAWGIGASGNEKTVRGELERLLNAGGTKEYRVMSGAFWGYGARQEMTVLIEFLDKFDPDIIVSLTGYNDVMTMMHDDGGVLQRPEARMLAEAVTAQLRPMDTLTALRKVGGSLGIWRLVVYFREMVDVGSKRAGNAPAYDAARSVKAAAQVAEFHRISSEFAARHGRRYMIFMQPDLYSTRKNLTPEEVATRTRFTFASRGVENVFPRYRQDLESSLSALPNVPYVSMRDAFDHVVESLFIDDCHLVDRGYQLLAETIARGLR